jgi:hypothetical protein
MTRELLLGLGTVIVAALLAILFFRRHKKDVSDRSPKLILNEVEVLMAYGRKKDAVSLLEEATQKYPQNREIAEKLIELK